MLRCLGAKDRRAVSQCNQPSRAEPVAGPPTREESKGILMKRRWMVLAFCGVATVSSHAADDAATVRHVPAKEMAQLFARAAMVRETPLYKVHASHREAPGVAEIHTLDTDVFYVVAGTATFVTGGTAVEPKTTAPNEIRGTRIEGGEAMTLQKGDAVIVPNGVPHWFKEVKGPFDYFVVKITAPAK